MGTKALRGLVAAYAFTAVAQPHLAPLALDDSDDIERYLAAFPATEYNIVESPLQLKDCPRHGWLQCMRIWWETPHIGRFYIEPRSPDLIKRLMKTGYVWEPHIVASIEKHVVPGTVALDLGAYIGMHAMLMGRLAGSAGRVYAFEPQRKVFRELHHNIQLNDLDDIVVPLRYALGASNAMVQMDVAPEHQGEINQGGVAVGTGGDDVEMRTLDSFGFDNVSLVKIDVEGFEDAVLAGAAETIRASKPIILIEILGGVDRTTATPAQRRRIDTTIKTIEAFGYRVDFDAKHDYIAVPE